MNGGDLMSIVRKAYEKDLLRRYGYVPSTNLRAIIKIYSNLAPKLVGAPIFTEEEKARIREHLSQREKPEEEEE